MREIKFRVWDGNKLRSPEIAKGLIGFNTDGQMIGISDDVKLMQFTALKDKNGKEIYEGDIIKYSMQDDIQDIPIVADMFNLRIGLEDKDTYLRLDDNFEIIGNIYENPELLGKEKEI